MGVKKVLKIHWKEAVLCVVSLLLVCLLSFSAICVIKKSIDDGTARQGIVEMGKGIKGIMEDINKD